MHESEWMFMRLSMTDKKERSSSGCSTSCDLQSSLFHFSVFNMLPQMTSHFNYSEAIDLLNKLTYSNLRQSHNSLLPYNVRSGSSVTQNIASGSDERIVL